MLSVLYTIYACVWVWPAIVSLGFILAEFLVSIARTYAQNTNGCLHRLVLAGGQGFVRKALVSSTMVEPDLHTQKESIPAVTPVMLRSPCCVTPVSYLVRDISAPRPAGSAGPCVPFAYFVFVSVWLQRERAANLSLSSPKRRGIS